jgi:hypothetical protein
MEIKVLTRSYKVAILTTEHPACSYGQPVLIFNNRPHGVGDLIDGEMPTVVIYVPPKTERITKTMQRMEDRLAIVNRWNDAVIRHGCEQPSGVLLCWVITSHPSDFPDSFVARLHADGKPTGQFAEFRTLEHARLHCVEAGFTTRFVRDPSDDVVIVESWF